MGLKVIKTMAVVLTTFVGFQSMAAGFLNTYTRTLTKEQAKTVGLVHARVIGAEADITSSVRLNFSPKYNVIYVSHLQYDDSSAGTYQVVVNRAESYQNCKITLTINDRTGALENKSVACGD